MQRITFLGNFDLSVSLISITPFVFTIYLSIRLHTGHLSAVDFFNLVITLHLGFRGFRTHN
jgi:hypothetical protein